MSEHVYLATVATAMFFSFIALLAWLGNMF